MTQGLDPTKPIILDPLLSEPVRINLQALASTNSGPTSPANPVEGWLWMDTSDPTNIKLNAFITGAFRVILANIQSGPPAQTSVNKFVFTQSVALTTWNVLHNLNTQELVVSVIDTSVSPSQIMIPDTIQMIDNNNVTITFTTAQSGQAVILG